MILDLTTWPPTVSMDECPDVIVVRTWAFTGVGSDGPNGLIGRNCPPEYAPTGKARYQGLKPGATLVQGGITCFETQVPLPNEGRAAYCYGCRGTGCSRCAHMRTKVYIEPWEVFTAAKDLVTGLRKTWRAALHIQRHPKNPDLWLIGVGHVSGAYSPPFVRLATKNLFSLQQRYNSRCVGLLRPRWNTRAIHPPPSGTV